MLTIVNNINAFLWGAPSLILLVGTGLFFTIMLKGMSFSRLAYAFKIAFTKDAADDEAAGDVSNFKVLMTSLAGMIGNGNIAGVATAITLGGPGSIFWMWIAGLLGMATKYAEALLGQIYRIKNEKGEYSGGPMYYIERGLGKKWKPLAIAYAFFAAIAALGTGNGIQSNTISGVLNSNLNISGWVTGGVLVVLTGTIIFGGIKRISDVAGFFVPILAVFYIAGSLLILIIKYDQILPAFGLIFQYAFTPVAAVGGFSGIAVRQGLQQGVSKGIFSNEAGMGTVAMISGSAKSSHPVRQALVSMTGTFIVTIIVCTMTGLILLVTGYGDPTGGLIFGVPHDPNLAGGALTSAAFSSTLGNFGEFIVALSVVFFGFSTIIGWYVYGQKSFEYLFGVKYVPIYGVIYLIATFVGSVANLSVIWAIADMTNGLMIIPNLIGLLLLSGVVKKETDNYFSDPKHRLKNSFR
jgi:AGCS family alanine or glycine:cation symporter